MSVDSTAGTLYRTLYLINPRQQYKHYSTQVGTSRLLRKKNTLAPLSLGILAALTPEHWDIRIFDEEAHPVEFGGHPDLVGITGLTNTIDRAFEIADEFRSRGIPVVFGGPHAGGNQEEILEHADAVAVGEGEELWPRILEDFEAGRMQGIYTCEEPVEFRTLPRPRWDLLNHDDYTSLPVQASRGCPFACDFCLVSRLFGRKKRFRDVDDVIGELAVLPVKRVFFVDDNLTINKTYARDLFSRMVGMGFAWICQSSIDVAFDDELLELMARAGCEQILIGFESLNDLSLAEAHKSQNHVSDYGRAVANIHSHGIFVLGSFVVGFDHDTLDELERIREFGIEHGIFPMAMNILGYSKGTDLYDRLVEEDRIIDIDNAFRGGMFPVIRYRNFSGEELFRAYADTVGRLFDYADMRIKAEKLFASGDFSRQVVYNDIPVRQKVRISLTLLRSYLFTADSEKRKFFFQMISYGRSGLLPVERIVMILISLQGYSAYIRDLQRQVPDFLRRIHAAYERSDTAAAGEAVGSEDSRCG